jgi:hypothetical protein
MVYRNRQPQAACSKPGDRYCDPCVGSNLTAAHPWIMRPLRVADRDPLSGNSRRAAGVIGVGMTRQESRFFVLMTCVFAAFFAADWIGSETVKTAVLIVFALVFVSHVCVADTSATFHGPVWLRRVQWVLVGGLLLVAVVLDRVF